MWQTAIWQLAWTMHTFHYCRSHLQDAYRREEIAEGAGLSRTIGWFTSMFPVRLEGSGPAGASPPDSPVGGGSDPAMPMSHIVEISAATHDRPRAPNCGPPLPSPPPCSTEKDAAELADLWLTGLRAVAAYAEFPHP